GGAAVVFVCLQGMVEQFNLRSLVGTQITLSRLLLSIPPVLAGYLAIRPRVRRGQVEQVRGPTGFVAGAAAGVVTGAVLSAGLVLVQLIGGDLVRRMFVSVSPALISILTFDHGTASGAAILIVGMGLLGAAGAAFRLVA